MMLFMDVAYTVLVKLREDENSFICEEEIEDMYCYKMQALTLVKCRHWTRTIDEEARRRRTSQEAARAAAALKKEKERAIAKEGERCRSATIAAILQETKNSPSLKNIVKPGAARAAAELESKLERAVTRNKNHCRTAAREELFRAIQSPPVLKTIPKPKRKTNHLVSIEIHIRKKYRGKSKGAGI